MRCSHLARTKVNWAWLIHKRVLLRFSQLLDRFRLLDSHRASPLSLRLIARLWCFWRITRYMSLPTTVRSSCNFLWRGFRITSSGKASVQPSTTKRQTRYARSPVVETQSVLYLPQVKSILLRLISDSIPAHPATPRLQIQNRSELLYLLRIALGL